jgi:hypothetical protein
MILQASLNPIFLTQIHLVQESGLFAGFVPQRKLIATLLVVEGGTPLERLLVGWSFILGVLFWVWMNDGIFLNNGFFLNNGLLSLLIFWF